MGFVAVVKVGASQPKMGVGQAGIQLNRAKVLHLCLVVHVLVVIQDAELQVSLCAAIVKSQRAQQQTLDDGIVDITGFGAASLPQTDGVIELRDRITRLQGGVPSKSFNNLCRLRRRAQVSLG